MLTRILTSKRTVAIACAISVALGLFFVLVWSPLPWGWEGIDHYHDRAARLAHGLPFDTTDVPWGYAYFVAAFYAVFGNHPVAVLIAQVAINAITPLLVYGLARMLVALPEARLAALLTGIFSFNTLYTSTLSSDSVCTALFLALMLGYVRGRQSGRLGWFIAAGVLAGIVPQLRPNLILFPGVMALIELATAPRARRIVHAVLILAFTALALAPWIVRNYRLTAEFLPTSTHGGVQLWYGSLQTGDYLESYADNPRTAFAPASFDYTTLAGRTIVVTPPQPCAPRIPLQLEYWTDRDPTLRRVDPSRDGEVLFEIPGQPAPTTVYHRLVSGSATESQEKRPPGVFFVSSSHFEDLDRHDDLLDVFDVMRLMRWLAWQEPPRVAAKLDLVPDGALDERDLGVVLQILSGEIQRHPGDVFLRLETSASAVVLHLTDGSRLEVPRDFGGRVTDLTVTGDAARGVLYARRSFAEIANPKLDDNPCGFVGHLVANAVFYRKEPQDMRRYFALAYDNIAREPAAFMAAAAYRVFRMFVIVGSDNRRAAQQFSASRIVYLSGTAVTVTYLLLFAVGAWITVRRYPAAWILIVPVLYVPLTIAAVLTNMRYTITIQPLGFIFVAVAAVTGWGRWMARRAGPSGTTRA